MSNLVIMESPHKAATVQSFLGSSYKVVACQGHVRDLPKSTLGVDIENGFKAKYINIRGKGDLIRELKKEAKNASKVYLATDPDREGEAISWHLAAALNIPVEETRRVTFNEVTKTAVKAAIKAPRNIDVALVNSQQARRILDRIVGYKLSPFLWKNVRSGLSAGRVQSVATRIIVERENEIRAFVPEEYHTLDAVLLAPKNRRFTAHYWGNAEGKAELKTAEQTDGIVRRIEGKPFRLTSLKETQRQRTPAPPFATSSLLQEASRKLGFGSARTMKVAQELYEGVNVGSGAHGLITYMRTDSLRISTEAQEMARDYIRTAYGEEYYPGSPRVFKTEADAQDAHEAIRPASLQYEPDAIKKHLSADQYKLYRLIWNRFIASQMACAQLDTVSAEFSCEGELFRASGTTVRFPGFMAVYDHAEDGEEEKNTKLPELHEGEDYPVASLLPEQHFTEPPPRYNEGSLIRFLKEKGIGRPSTYASIITTILSRGYVQREGKALRPTQLGEVTTDLMVRSFPDIVDYVSTAKMESTLDSIEDGKTTMEEVLGSFYEGFARDLEQAQVDAEREEIKVEEEVTDILCEKCGSRMVIKSGRFGRFAACPNYPNCKCTLPLDKDGKVIIPPEPEKTGEICPLCGAEMLKRRGRYGDFIACANYPTCKSTKQILKEIGVPCPKCGGAIVAKHGRNRSFFYACVNYPGCDFLSWDQPTNEKCPKCGEMLFLRKGTRICHNKECGYKAEDGENA